jgi:hypothetical protein
LHKLNRISCRNFHLVCQHHKFGSGEEDGDEEEDKEEDKEEEDLGCLLASRDGHPHVGTKMSMLLSCK